MLPAVRLPSDVGLQSKSDLHVFSSMGIKSTTVDLLMGGGEKKTSHWDKVGNQNLFITT